MSHAGALIVFARAPRAGAVKTRLAATLGAAEAAAVYARLLSRALRFAEDSRFAWRYLFAADTAEIGYFENRLDPERWRVRAQCGGDIGRRMHHAFAAILHDHQFAVLVGSDVADCTVADLDRAWAILARDQAPVVIGPSADGGYWLIGLRKANRLVFDDIPWSTSKVLAATHARIVESGLGVVSLAPRHDVDEYDDLRFLA